jgi:hypothetical protein
MFSSNLLARIKELHLPLGQYVVVGSGTLDVLGIRLAGDIDIAVMPELFNKLQKDGSWEEEERYGKIFFKKNGIDIIPKLFWKKYLTTTSQAIASALIIDGVAFMNLGELKRFKKALGREKDISDITFIEQYEKKIEKDIL